MTQSPTWQALYLAAAVVAATPTSNTLALLVEAAGGDRDALTLCVFTQYLCAPIVLTGSLTFIVSVTFLYT